MTYESLPLLNPFPGESTESRTSTWWLIFLIILLTGLIYLNSLYGGFLYDDHTDIVGNASIQKLVPIKDLITVNQGGRMVFLTRPVVNVSFALSYAMGGMNPFYFHLFNLIIHISAALALFGIIRRTLSLPKLKPIYGNSIPLLSFLIATLWAIHPLQTESVSYITQRYESLMGCLALISFYCAIRVGDSPNPIRWSLLSAFACLLALGSKEVAVSIPLLILLFDRAFMAGSFKEAWRSRRLLYLALMVAWACFGWVQLQAQGRAAWAGLTLPMPWWRYALSQPGVILHYLYLVIWPQSLCIDYNWPPAKTLASILPGAMVIGGLFLGTVYALVRRPGLGFLGASFFLILAPTSSVMPILDLAVEHRMYLPLAPILVLMVLGGYHFALHCQDQHWITGPRTRLLIVGVVALAMASLGALTFLRNEVYHSARKLWADAVHKVPTNPRARINYGSALEKENNLDAAAIEFAKAIELDPLSAMAYSNLGVIYNGRGQIDQSFKYLVKAVTLAPKNARFINNLGVAFVNKELYDDALICFKNSIQFSPNYAPGYVNLAKVYFHKKDYKNSIANYRKSIEIRPWELEYRWGMAVAYLESGDEPSATSLFQEIIRGTENPLEPISMLGWVYWQYKKDAQAIPPLRAALKMSPSHVASMLRLSWILATSPETILRNGGEAVKLAEAALASTKNRTPEILDFLAAAYAEAGRYSEAQALLQEAIEQSTERPKPWIEALHGRLTLYKGNKPFRDFNRIIGPPGSA